MAYIGNTVENQGFTPAIDYFNGDGVTVTFTLSRPIASVAQVIVAIDNVIQNPSSSYTVAGSAITFSSAPLSGTNNIWVEYTSLITTYQGISQDPTVIGDIRATGGYLAEGDFGNSFVDGVIVDYVTGLGRVTVGTAEGIALYNGGTASRTERMRIDSSGNVGIGTASPAAVTGFTTDRKVVQVTNNGYGQLRLGATSGTMLDHDDSGNTITTLRSLYGATSASAQMQFQSGFITFGTGTSFTERMRIASDGTISTTIGSTLYGAYPARAWVNFNGTGTVAIRTSRNVTSITDSGTGQYTVNFTTSMPDGEYSLVGTTNADTRVVSISSLSTSGGAIRTTNSAGALEDQSVICVTMFR